METRFLLICLSTISSFPFSYASSTQSFQFRCFNQSIINQHIVLSSDAYASGNRIHLTKSGVNEDFNWSMGWAVYNQPITLWKKHNKPAASFDSYFQFIIQKVEKSHHKRNKRGYGDGLAFFISKAGFSPVINSSGLFLGLFNETTDGKASTEIIAVEFDTFKNDKSDEYHRIHAHDPDDNHLGIDVNSITSRDTYSLGRGHLNGNITWHCWVLYNGFESVLRVYISSNETKPEKPVLSYNIDLRKFLPHEVQLGFSASTGLSHQLHTIESWALTVTTPRTSSSMNLSISIMEALGFAVTVLVLLIIGSICLVRRRAVRSKRYVHASPCEHRYKDLSMATNNFSSDNKLGRGASGTVYKGLMKCTKQVVAVKKIHEQMSRDYLAELRLINRLDHPNLVRLLGWCHERDDCYLLVYEFMCKGSLDKHLFDCNVDKLAWPVRYKMALELASAVAYLHEGRILHRDIKSSNVMLGPEFEGKIGDFGMASLIDGRSRVTLRGYTPGYLAPECAATETTNVQSDVYSYGVVCLEIASGKPAIISMQNKKKIMRLVDWAWEMHENGCVMNAADPRLCGEFDENEMRRVLNVGLWCTVNEASSRPTMKEVYRVLHDPMAELPCVPVSNPPFIPPGHNIQVQVSSEF